MASAKKEAQKLAKAEEKQAKIEAAALKLQEKEDKKDAKRAAKQKKKLDDTQYKLEQKNRKKAIKRAKKEGTYKKEDFFEPDNRIRIGVIGCGGIFNGCHVPAYLREEQRVKVVALCDIIGDRAANAKKKYFREADIYTDYKQLLEDESIDAVDICTPNYLHSIIAVEALKKGKNVFCEKPDAINPEEAAKMYAAAEESGKLLMIMRNNRFNPNSQYLKQYIDEGHMGEIYVARTAWIRRRGIPGKGGWFTTKEQSGGGPLIDLGVHMIDLAMWFMDFPKPVAVTAMTYNCFSDTEVSDSVNSKFGDKVAGGTFDVEDLAIGSIRFENGAVLQLEISWASNVEKEDRYVELRGTKAGATWKNERVMIYEEGKKGKQITRTVQKNVLIPQHSENLINFFDVLEGNAEPSYQIYQGAMMMKILDSLYESAENDGKEVLL